MTLIIAHRGASFDAPENTLAAFDLAWKQQADGIEGDYCFTLDQQVVCIHDESTLRTGGVDLVVAGSTWDQLKLIDVGSWKDGLYRGQAIPTLAQVLDSTPKDRWCVLELKTGPEIVPLVEKTLNLSKFPLDNILIIAFDPQTIAESKRRMSTVKAHWLVDYLNDPESGWSPSAERIIEVVHACGADGIGSQALTEVLTPKFWNRLRIGGVSEFHVWTVDDPNDARYFRDLGAWGITTNKPAFIRQVLAST